MIFSNGKSNKKAKYIAAFQLTLCYANCKPNYHSTMFDFFEDVFWGYTIGNYLLLLLFLIVGVLRFHPPWRTFKK